MIRFFNTLGRRMTEFTPIREGYAGMYTCGPTVYNYAHIGNFRAYLFEDLLRRTLEYHGIKVTQVMNLTDVDDKTIRDSRAAGLPLQTFTRKYKDAFFEDLRTLRVEPAGDRGQHTDLGRQADQRVLGLAQRGVGQLALRGKLPRPLQDILLRGRMR